MLGVQWALTVVGILFKTRFAGRSPLVSVLIYLAMGWMIVFIYAPARRELSQEALQFLLAGGLSYSIGTIAYLMKKVPYTHAIWHLFVMGGTIFHYSAVYLSL